MKPATRAGPEKSRGRIPRCPTAGSEAAIAKPAGRGGATATATVAPACGDPETWSAIVMIQPVVPPASLHFAQDHTELHDAGQAAHPRPTAAPNAKNAASGTSRFADV